MADVDSCPHLPLRRRTVQFNVELLSNGQLRSGTEILTEVLVRLALAGAVRHAVLALHPDGLVRYGRHLGADPHHPAVTRDRSTRYAVTPFRERPCHVVIHNLTLERP